MAKPTADEFGTAIREALRKTRRAEYLTGLYVSGRDMEQVGGVDAYRALVKDAEETTVAMWRMFYDFAAAETTTFD